MKTIARHADYLIEVFEDLVASKDSLRGYRIVWQPGAMRHFTARFSPLGAA